MIILNDGSPTFFNGRHTTAIDVTAVSRSLAGRMQWSVNPDLYGSDHYPVQVQLFAAAIPAATRRPRWRYDEANWESYGETFQSLLQQRNPDSIENLTEAINAAASATIPKTSSIPGRKALRWWNEETKKAVKARRKALRRVKRLPIDDPDRENALCTYRERHNQCRQLVRDAKRSSWTNFLESINASQSSAELWGKVNALSGKRHTTTLHLQVDGAAVSDPAIVADKLGDYFADLSAISKYEATFQRLVNPSTSSVSSFRVIPDTNNLRINHDFTWQELQFALSRSNGKSAGPDEIGYPLLKNLPTQGKVKMLELFNQLWRTDSYPELWRESLVVPIPKANEPTRDVAKFRPIALTCCMAKVFERMVNRRLKQFLESGGLLDHRQHAFRQGHGTSTYFATLGELLKDAKDNGLHTELVSLDIAKAFNRTWTPAVLKQLVSWGLSGHIIHFVQNFLTSRSFRVSVGNTKSRTFCEETGVPQGSVIAVTLFLIAMNSIFERLPANIYIFVYADDVLIVATGQTPGRTRIRAQAGVSAVAKWAASKGFQLSAGKSARCHVCQYRHRVCGPSIKIGNQAIPLKKTVKLLGVVIDRSLSFEQHLQGVKASCRSRINLIRTISRPHRSNNREVRFRVARAIVDSRLMYGLELTCIATDKAIQILAPVYNSYTRIISGLLPSTPADASCVEAGTLPFRYRIYAAIANKAAAFSANTAGNDRICLLSEGDRVLRTIANAELPPVAKIHWYGDKSWQSPAPNIDSRIKEKFRAGDNSVALRRSVAELTGLYPNYMHRYTDGSRSRAGVGMGIAGDISPTSRSLPKQCSVFSAEAAAILHAVTVPADGPILILSDSHSVIQALSSEVPVHPWIQGILKVAPSNTTYAWIPGHCGIPGNIEADNLAGSGPSGPRYSHKVPLQDVKRWITCTVRTAWATEWSRARLPFIRKIKGDIGKWTDLANLRDQRIFSRLRTGHSLISQDFSGGPFRKTCEFCHIPSTVEHVLCVCPQFEHLRRLHGLPASVRDMLADVPSTQAAVLGFLKAAKLYCRI